MARVVVWAKRDNDHPDPLVDARKYKAGMVVVILEDGQPAGQMVDKSDWFRIIEMPGVPASDLGYLVEADPLPEDMKNFPTLKVFPRKRITVLDLDAIEAAAGLSAKQNPTQTITIASKLALDSQALVSSTVDNPLVFSLD
jgi:hypothetical protein